MILIKERAGANLVQGAGLIVNNTPEDEEEEQCVEFGKSLASL